MPNSLQLIDLGHNFRQALAKTLSAAQLGYLQKQFTLLGPNKNGFISMQNFKTVGSFPDIVQFDKISKNIL